MSTKQLFPKCLLTQHIETRLDYFDNFRAKHPSIQDVDNKLTSLIDRTEGNLALVYGPTGVGKTTLKLTILNRLIQKETTELQDDPGYIPVANILAKPPHTGNFDWKEYYCDLLEGLNEPLIDHKLDITKTSMKRTPTNKNPSLKDLRHSSINALKFRRTKIILIDEAQHLGKISSGRKLQDQMDILKSMAEETEVLHILFGTYEMLPFRHLSGQLSRRNCDIHFPSYRVHIKEDLKAFKGVLKTFQYHVPVRQEPDLLKNWDFFFERSLGCVGILKDWFRRALSSSLNSGKKTIPMSAFKETALPVSACQKIANEIQEGEKILQIGESNQQLREYLGLNIPLQEENKKPTQGKNQNVGIRNPTRDPVGNEGAG